MPTAYQTQHVQGAQFFAPEVSIPANASTAVTVLSLVTASIPSGQQAIGFKINGTTSAGAQRSAIIYGDSTTNLKGYSVAGADCAPPVVDLASVFVKAASGGAVTATIEIYVR